MYTHNKTNLTAINIDADKLQFTSQLVITYVISRTSRMIHAIVMGT